MLVDLAYSTTHTYIPRCASGRIENGSSGVGTPVAERATILLGLHTVCDIGQEGKGDLA